MTPKRRREILQAVNLYGSANCWTGTSGTLAAMIREVMMSDILDALKHAGTYMEKAGNCLQEALPHANPVESMIVLQLLEIVRNNENKLREFAGAVEAGSCTDAD